MTPRHLLLVVAEAASLQLSVCAPTRTSRPALRARMFRAAQWSRSSVRSVLRSQAAARASLALHCRTLETRCRFCRFVSSKLIQPSALHHTPETDHGPSSRHENLLFRIIDEDPGSIGHDHPIDKFERRQPMGYKHQGILRTDCSLQESRISPYSPGSQASTSARRLPVPDRRFGTRPHSDLDHGYPDAQAGTLLPNRRTSLVRQCEQEALPVSQRLFGPVLDIACLLR